MAPHQPPRLPALPWWPLLLAATVGFDLVIVQYFMVREATADLRVNELIALLGICSFFLSFSLGYALGPRLGETGVRRLGWPILGIHACFPFGTRWVAALAFASSWRWLALVLMTAYLALTGAVFHAALVTSLASQVERHGRRIIALYAADLTGAVVGLMAAVPLLSLDVAAGWAVHLAIMTLLVCGWPFNLRRLVAAGLVAVVYAAAAPKLNIAALEAFFHASYPAGRGYTYAYSQFSPYNRVDVFRSPDNRNFLFLDGNLYFGTDALAFFDGMLVGLPAEAVKTGDALVVGSGSMSTVGILAPRMTHITTCEIDPVVVEAGRRFYGAQNHLEDPAVQAKWHLVLDDGRHYLRSTDQRYALIAFDVPVAQTIQLGLLASMPVLESARAHLTPGGVVAFCTGAPLDSDNPYGLAVASAFLRVFPHVLYVESPDRAFGFMYGSDDLTAFASMLSTEQRRRRLIVYSRTRVGALVGDQPPIGLGDLSVVRALCINRLWSTYGPQ